MQANTDHFQDIRHTYSGYKSNLNVRKAVGGTGMQLGQLSTKLTKGELRYMLAGLKGPPRCSGFHEFITSDEVQTQLPQLLENREKMRMRAAADMGKTYQKERAISAHHAVKCELWNKLGAEEQERWEQQAREVANDYHLSRDP